MPAYKDLLEHDYPRIAFFKKAWKLHAWACFGILATGGVSYYNHATGEPELVLLGSHIAVLLLGIYAGVIMASMILIKVQLAADNPGDIWWPTFARASTQTTITSTPEATPNSSRSPKPNSRRASPMSESILPDATDHKQAAVTGALIASLWYGATTVKAARGADAAYVFGCSLIVVYVVLMLKINGGDTDE